MTRKISIIFANNNVDTFFYYPPLGGLYITSFLKHKGIDANYYDFTIVNLINRYYPIPKTPIAKEYNLKTIEGYGYRSQKITKEFEKL